MRHVRRSVQCYLDQTYPNKELVVVNEGPKEYQEEMDTWFSGLGRSDIRPVWLNGEYTLGALRNISMGVCRGDYICQWDDDDFCMPFRLSSQYSHLSNTPDANVCYLGDQLHFYFSTGELYWDNWKRYHSGNRLCYSLIPGTLMAARDLGVRYPSSGKDAKAGEDSVFSNRLISAMQDQIAILSGMGYMHVYSYHGDNQVYDLTHHNHISKCRSQPRVDVVRHRNQICDTIDYLNLPGEVRVMCRDGLVFTHRSRHANQDS